MQLEEFNHEISALLVIPEPYTANEEQRRTDYITPQIAAHICHLHPTDGTFQLKRLKIHVLDIFKSSNSKCLTQLIKLIGTKTGT